MSELTELTELTAVDAVAVLKSKDASPRDFVEAALTRIEAVDGPVNALPTLCADRARDTADRADAGSILAGLPVVVKDLNDVAGVRTTYGSPAYTDHVPERSDIMVERLEQNGAVPIAKSNTPEFGAGANTFNEVFGKTRNPWNTALTCGGSSGGSAVALSTGMAWLATGSDLGGSLRTPASFCGVVGMRPSPGTVARSSGTAPYDMLSVQGPMGRTVEDVALMLDAMSGRHAEDPISQPAPETSFLSVAQNPKKPARIAFSPDLGFLPVDAQVRSAVTAAMRYFQSMGVEVEETCPDFSDTPQIFQTLRASLFAAGHADDLENHREKLKSDVVWNIEKGLALSAGDIGKAERGRAALYARMVRFFEQYDILACPTALVPPFDVDQRYVEEIEGHRFDNYVDWLGITYAITCTSCPAISVPCGFTESGIPIGLQLVGRPRGDAELLGFASLFQKETGLSTDPIDPRT